MSLTHHRLVTVKTTYTHYQKTAGLKNMLKKKFKVEMTVDCKPSLIEHLLEEFVATADFENANVNSYTYYGINNEQEEAGSN